MKQITIASENSLVEFLKKNNVEALPANQVEEYHLQWWKREGIKGDVEIAISDGYFFIAVKEKNIGLFVHNERDNWYNLVCKWGIDIAEKIFIQELNDLIQASDEHVWIRVRRTVFDSGWNELIADIKNHQAISPDLKEKIFQFHEGLVEFPMRIKEFKLALLELLAFLTNDGVLTSTNCLVLYKYFPFDKYERSGLPIEFKLVINKMSKQFYNGNIPKQGVINELFQEAKSLIN